MRLRQWKQVMLAAVLLLGASNSVRAEDAPEQGGTLTGVAVAKGDSWIEVRADGAEKSTRYRARWIGGMPKDGGGPEKEAVDAIRKVATPNRVQLRWVVEEGPRVVALEVLRPQAEQGVVEGTIAARGETWIEVAPLGGGPAERYTPRWIGGMPKDGGGLDKDILRALGEFKVGDNVRIEWQFDERKRVVAIRGNA